MMLGGVRKEDSESALETKMLSVGWRDSSVIAALATDHSPIPRTQVIQLTTRELTPFPGLHM